jgi:hypothetical protein
MRTDGTPTRPPLESSAALLAAGASKPVFDCRWPEASRVAERLWAAMPGLGARLYDEPWLGGQDAMHETFLDAWLAWRRGVVVLDEEELPHRYATAGSSEAIRECLAQFAVGGWQGGRRPVLHLFHGEYEGYSAVAEGYGIRIERHDRASWRDSFDRIAAHGAGDLVMISQPSAIDGNIWADFSAFLRHLESRCPQLQVAVDLTYVGTVARDYEIDVSSPLIGTVIFSLSKVFGVYYHRVGGVLSRRPMPGIIGTRWFKNTFSLELGRLLLTELPPKVIPRTYASHQAQAARAIGEALGVSLVASDAVLIAHHPWTPDAPPAVAPLRRAGVVRYCLTPTIDRLLREERGDSGRVHRQAPG